jgi:hypothetical protein
MDDQGGILKDDMDFIILRQTIIIYLLITKLLAILEIKFIPLIVEAIFLQRNALNFLNL